VSAAASREMLEERIARERAALAAAIDELRTRTRAELELRTRVRERPSVWLGGALVLGFWMGARR
jgi:hypothetical protein